MHLDVRRAGQRASTRGRSADPQIRTERRSAPRYAVIETLGPPHQRIFHVEVSWDGGSIQGEGHSIKAAEAAAARAALEGMKVDESEVTEESAEESSTST